ncbi:MAG: hypothetical protein GXO64_01200, partial [Candidatus Micrarchaeota archaeon]|nr:hypothetical protein [Candidatus Micrarchaeota archaeon]
STKTIPFHDHFHGFPKDGKHYKFTRLFYTNINDTDFHDTIKTPDERNLFDVILIEASDIGKGLVYRICKKLQDENNIFTLALLDGNYIIGVKKLRKENGKVHMPTDFALTPFSFVDGKPIINTDELIEELAKFNYMRDDGFWQGFFEKNNAILQETNGQLSVTGQRL